MIKSAIKNPIRRCNDFLAVIRNTRLNETKHAFQILSGEIILERHERGGKWDGVEEAKEIDGGEGKKAIDDILAISRATSADRGYRTRTEQWWQVAETPPVGWRPFGSTKLGVKKKRGG